MSLVLAIEPDDNQARLLRGLVGGPETELVMVMSPDAAAERSASVCLTSSS